MTFRQLSLAALLSLVACGDKDGDTDTDSDTDTDTDADTDTDGGTDADTDTDTDGGTDADTDSDSDTDGGTDADADSDADTDTDGGPETEDECDDGIDNDADGATDCDDTDCATDEACFESICNDGIDNDDDGLTDCDDDDCLGVPVCPELECDDDIDNDGDRAVDCADADCLDDPACKETVCDDGLDDDGDGATDCDDDDCFGEPYCYESDCDDDDDEDGDGLIDCRDTDCFGTAACKESDCDNGLDDDEDGAADCLDVDCWRTTVCLAECADGEIGAVTGEALATGDTEGAGDDFSDLDECGTSGAEDEGVVWTVPADGCYEIYTAGSSFDTVLRLYEDCETGEDACDDSSGEDGTSSLVYYEGQEGENLVIVVDGASDSDAGEWTLSIGEYEYLYDVAIGSVTGEAAYSSDIDGTEDMIDYWYYSACASDYTYTDALLWAPPYAGTWTFDTSESEFDTVLTLWGVGDRCPVELGCNDDEAYPDILTSTVSVELEEGQPVVIVVAGYNEGELGDYQLDIAGDAD